MNRKIKFRIMKCNYCGKEYDKKEIRRIYGKDSMVDLGGFCSAGCYTAFILKLEKKEL